jgi:hypothetical protein
VTNSADKTEGTHILTPEVLVIGPAHPAAGMLLKLSCKMEIWNEAAAAVAGAPTVLKC